MATDNLQLFVSPSDKKDINKWGFKCNNPKHGKYFTVPDGIDMFTMRSSIPFEKWKCITYGSKMDSNKYMKALK